MKKIVVTMFTALFLLSCNDDVITEKTDVSQTNISSLAKVYKNKNKLESHKNLAFSGEIKRSIDDIKKIAVKVAENMRVKQGVVTKAPIEIKSIELVNGVSKKPYIKTKGAELNDHGVLINFERNQGYVLVSPDKRVASVLCFSLHGNSLDLNNPGVQVLFSRIPHYVEKQISYFERVRPELKKAKEEDLFKKLSGEKKQDLIARGLFDEKGKRIVSKSCGDELKNILFKSDDECTYHYHDEVYFESSAPLLKTLWSDDGMYNDKVPYTCEYIEQPLLPSASVAMGQIMAYHKFPRSVKGTYMNWEEITELKDNNMFSNIYSISEEAKENVQYLLARLGWKDLLDIKYNNCPPKDNTPLYVIIYDLKAVEVFRDFGYTTSNIKKYDFPELMRELRAKRPVYMLGASYTGETMPGGTMNNPFVPVEKKRHSWVVDGYVNFCMEEYDYPCDFEGNPQDRPKLNYDVYGCDYYVHSNFGWGGQLSGYGNEEGEGRYLEENTSGWFIEGLFDPKGGHDRMRWSNYFNDHINSKAEPNGAYNFESVFMITVKK